MEKIYNNIPDENASQEQEKQKLLSELENLKLQFSELEATNSHLIAATWRERDLKKKLSDTVDELNQTRQIVETQNKRITESINYARKIQLAINPTETDLQSYFPESFILYLPKDLISGDFPWLYKKGDYVYIAAVDCTGHGVPGAMMSMIGNLLLNDIVNDDKTLLPSEILNHLHSAVVQTLKQNFADSNSNDGMDVGLCRVNIKTNEVLYSGAHRPLFLLKDGKIQSFSGDKFPIGGMHYKGMNAFTDHTLMMEKNDTLFLSTDGFADQIGGELRQKLMVKNLRAHLETTSPLKLNDTKSSVYNFYTEWKGANKQIDDILIIGIKF